MGAEDFGRYAEGKTPIFMYFLGTASREKYEASLKPGGPPLPGLHTDANAPVPEPSIRTGVRTMSLAAHNAGQEARHNLQRLAAEYFGWDEEAVTLREGRLVDGASGASVAIEEIAARSGARPAAAISRSNQSS